jgi:hypothetical protein
MVIMKIYESITSLVQVEVLVKSIEEEQHPKGKK